METSYGQSAGAADYEMGKIFVGGLSWETNKDTLQQYFEQFGEVTDSVIMSDPVSRKPRGFGFVTFKDPNSVAAVMNCGSHVVDNKTVDPKPAQKKGGGAPAVQATVAGTKKIFVGGLPAGTTDDDLRTYFSRYGNVTEVDLKMDKNTNRMRGFGFVGFDSEAVVDTVVSTRFHQLNGKSVETKKAEPRGAPSKVQQSAEVYSGPTQTSSQYSYQGYFPPQQQQPSYNSYAYGGAAMYAGGRGGYMQGSFAQDPSAYDTSGYSTEVSATPYPPQSSYAYSSQVPYEMPTPHTTPMASYGMASQRQQQQPPQHQQRGQPY